MLPIQSSSTNSLPAWRAEREELLHRICGKIKAALDAGQPLQATIRFYAKRCEGQPFKSDPSRCLVISQGTLLRFWYAWCAGGEVPSVFRLRWKPRRPRVPAALIQRFIAFCARCRQPNFRTAWRAFESRGGAFGRCAPMKIIPVNYGQVRRLFPLRSFRQLQDRLKAIDEATKELGTLRLQFSADVQRRCPARLVRSKAGKEPSNLKSGHSRTNAPRLKAGGLRSGVGLQCNAEAINGQLMALEQSVKEGETAP